MTSKFTHLHVHSHFSLLNALPKIPELVEAAKKDGMTALALTDNGNLYGAIEFYKTCKKAGVKPIIGVDAYVALRTRHDKDAGIDNVRTRLVLLVKSETGYKNLIRLVTASYLEGFYYRPRIDTELMEKYGDGLIAISPSFSGDAASALKHGDKERAKEIISKYKKTFGDEDFFLEITHHPEIEGHEKLMNEIIAIATETNTALVAAHDVYYIHPEERKVREVMMSVQNGTGPREKGAFSDGEEDFSFIGTSQAEKLFKDNPEAIENTEKIASMCNLELTLGSWVFPYYETRDGLSHDEELRRIVYEGLRERNLTETKEIKERIDHELGVIKFKGYAPYFLVVADLLNFARKNGILSTTRGSAAGSMVSYLTHITTVNPLEYKLPFERFLYPERPSAPDIDMDIADNRRDEMIEYAKKKYGTDRVAQVGTFGTMMARGSVRDVSRALGFPYTVGDRIAKLIPMGSQGFPMTIDTALETVSDLKKLYTDDADTKVIIDMAKQIEGCARHISVHAAGVVMSPKPLTEYVPLQFDPKGGKIITQFDMHAVEDAGLLKFDFLGIRNLAILSDAVKITEKVYGTKIDIENIPLDDRKTFEMLARGETIGLFQLNGSGMTRFLKDLKPSTIHDVNAMVALYRPGPMENLPKYIERKHNPALVTYLDSRMKDILSQSYGVITYQDDVMLIAVKLAGYSWLEVDKLRKAMGKKIPAEMNAQKEKLVEGFVKNGLKEKTANELWQLIEPFAAYGFNKAHAASYGKVAYQTAYMKANFPVVYMSAVLTAESGDVEKIAEIVAECKRMEIPVLPPSINESFGGFTVVSSQRPDLKNSKGSPLGEQIRFGLYTIKNFGEGIADTIIVERKRGGKFTALAEFLDRITDKNLNKKSLEALIKCGALDEFGERGVMLGNIESILSYNKDKNSVSPNQDSLFGLMTDSSTIPQLKLEPKPPATQTEKLGWEKELLGLYISGHPLDKYKDKFTSRSRDINKIKIESKEGMTVVVGGIVEEMKEIMTKGGEKMYFVRLGDYGSSIETVIFPRIVEKFKDLLAPEKCIAIKGRYSLRNGNPSVVADKIKAL